jgi:hypothetical protein
MRVLAVRAVGKNTSLFERAVYNLWWIREGSYTALFRRLSKCNFSARPLPLPPSFYAIIQYRASSRARVLPVYETGRIPSWSASSHFQGSVPEVDKKARAILGVLRMVRNKK